MLPFAYSFRHYSYGELDDSGALPTVTAIYAHIIAAYPCRLRTDLEITAHFDTPGMGKASFSLDGNPLFKHQHVLDGDALITEARVLIKEDAEKQAAWLKTLTGTVTGSPWLCDMGEDYVVGVLRKDREYSWKAVEEIDWDAQIARLVEGWSICGHRANRVDTDS
jgi:hypothetical protein